MENEEVTMEPFEGTRETSNIEKSTVQKRRKSRRSKQGKVEARPAQKLIEVFGRKIVVILALISFGGGTALCLTCILHPAIALNPTARFFICLLAAFFFSVFMFTLFPADLTLKLRAWLQIPFVLVGPAALWFVILYSLLKLLPSDQSQGKVFKPSIRSEPLAYSTTWVLSWKPEEPVYYKLEAQSDPNKRNRTTLLEGFYVQFDGKQDRYIAEIGSGPTNNELYERFEIEFNRNDSTYELKPSSSGKVDKE
jgi:hypothetical protein